MRPECLKIGLDDTNASMKFKYWLQCCEDYLQVLILPSSIWEQIKKETGLMEEVLFSNFKFKAVKNLVYQEIGLTLKMLELS